MFQHPGLYSKPRAGRIMASATVCLDVLDWNSVTLIPAQHPNAANPGTTRTFLR